MGGRVVPLSLWEVFSDTGWCEGDEVRENIKSPNPLPEGEGTGKFHCPKCPTSTLFL